MSQRQNQNPQISQDQQSFDVWRQQLSGQLNCKRNDMKCWTSLLPKLSCQIDDIHCWKTRIPSIPCSENDTECWRQLLPNLPCKLDDHNCWKDIKTGQVLREVNPHEAKIIDITMRQEGIDPMRSLERAFGIKVPSDIQ